VELSVKKRRPRIEIVPMIDVIFFLLVFFMVYGTLESTRTAVQVELPKTIHVGDPTTPTLIVGIREDGSVWAGDVLVTLDELQRTVEIKMQERPDTMVVLNPDRGVVYENLINVMDTLAAGGVQQPMLGVERKKTAEE
jgi:biopolymer transport protein ExbD